MGIFLLVVGILLFISLVVVHEFGHFVMARRNGVKVEEFGIFFPPRLYKRKMRGGWNFTINLIPLGGFVKMKGEHDSDTEPGTFGAAGLWAKTKIMAAGVVMNLIVGLVLFTIVALIGMPKLLDNQFSVKSDTTTISQKLLVGYIEPGSPANQAGLQPRDELNDIEIPGNSPVSISDATPTSLPAITKSFAGKTVRLFIVRRGHHQEVQLTLRSNSEVAASRKAGSPKGYLGIEPQAFSLRRSTWSAPVVAVGLSAQLTGLTFQGLGHALAGLGSLIAGGVTGNTPARQHGQTKASADVSGPVGIYVTLKEGSQLGYQYMLFIIAYISLALAVMNILPIPALDGGRLWLTLISRSVRRPLSARQEETINVSGFLVLIGLIILITIVDVKRFF